MNANSSRSHAVFTLDIRLSYSGLAAQITATLENDMMMLAVLFGVVWSASFVF